MTDTVAGRLQDLGVLWHAWRAAILEDIGELPPKFDDILLRELRSELEKHRETLERALTSCNTTLATLRRDSSGVRSTLARPVETSTSSDGRADEEGP